MSDWISEIVDHVRVPLPERDGESDTVTCQEEEESDLASIAEMPDLGKELLPERGDVSGVIEPQDGTDEPELNEISKMPDLGKVPLPDQDEK